MLKFATDTEKALDRIAVTGRDDVSAGQTCPKCCEPQFAADCGHEFHEPSFADRLRWVINSRIEWENERPGTQREEFLERQFKARRADLLAHVAKLEAFHADAEVLDWLGGLLYDEGNLLLSRIAYPDGPVVRIATFENGDGDERRIAESDRSESVTAGLREAIGIAVNRVPS